jgi:hypothetical protein
MSLRAFLTLCLLLCLSSLALAGQPASPVASQAPTATVTQAPTVTAPVAAGVPAPAAAIAEVLSWLTGKSNSSKLVPNQAPLGAAFRTCTNCLAEFNTCKASCGGDPGCLSACEDDYACCHQLCTGHQCF